MNCLGSSQHATGLSNKQCLQQHRPLCAVQHRHVYVTDQKHALTRQIKHASSTVELLQLHSAHRHVLDDVHISALFGRLASTCNADHPQHASSGSPSRLKQQQSPQPWSRYAEPHTGQQKCQQQHADGVGGPPVTAYPCHLLPPWQQQGDAQQQRVTEMQHPSADLVHASNAQQQIDGHWQLQQHMQDPLQHQQLLLSLLLDDLQQHIPSMRPRAVSSILWALAKLETIGTHQQQQPHTAAIELQQQMQQVVPLMLHRAHQQLGFDSFEPRQLCSVAYALTRLHNHQYRGRSRGQRSSRGADRVQQQQQWEPGLLDDLYSALGEQLHCCSAQDAAQAVYTAAQLQYTPSAGWLDKWLHCAHWLLPKFTPQGLANSAYGLVRVMELSGQLMCQHRHRSSSSSREVVQQRLQEQGHDSGKLAVPTALAAAAGRWLQACMRVSVLHLSHMQARELYGQLLWACGKLQCPPPQPAQHHILARSQALLVDCDTQQLATAVYCFALLQQQPPGPWPYLFWEQVTRKLNSFQGLGLAKLLWSMAQLQLQPPEQLLPKLMQRVISQVDRSSAGCLVSALYSMVVLGWQLPGRYLVRFQAAVLLQLAQFSSRDFSNMLWALATARVKVDGRWLERVLMASSSQLSSFTPTDLSMMVWAVAKLQHKPARQWLLQLLSSSLHKLPAFQPQHYSNTLWALSKLEAAPSPLWLNNFWSNSRQTLTQFGPAELTATVSAVVKLQLLPPVDWLQSLTDAVNRNLALFDSSRLLYILQAIQQLQARHASSSCIGVLHYGSSNGSRGYIYSSSIVPVGRLQLQRALRLSRDSSSALNLKHQENAAVDVLQQLDSSAAEAYSMACLVVLMPSWLQQKVAHWPKQLAAERALTASSSGGAGQDVGYRAVRQGLLVAAG